jgi:hypothetical protein
LLRREERTFLRVLGLLLGEVFVFARHTVTQELLALGLTDYDWSAWYRLFSLKRFQPEAASAVLFAEALVHVPIDQPYVIGADGVQVPNVTTGGIAARCAPGDLTGLFWRRC